MINMIYGGDDAFDSVVFGEQNPANVKYFQREIESITSMGSTLTEMGQRFFSNANDLFERFNGSEAMRIAKAATRAVKSLFMPNQIMPLYDIAALQQAQPIMQRWVMANPAVRELFHKQGCDGYSDSYIDMYPGLTGEKHYDYRRVMTGVVQETDSDEWYVKHYPDELVEGDKDLTHIDKMEILSTWQIAEMFLHAGKDDPTSPYNTVL